MANYYTSHTSRSQAFLLERRLKSEGIACELTYMPRQIMTDLCNMGVRFNDAEFPRAINAVKRAGLPGCKVYKEIMYSNGSQYTEVNI